MIKADVVEVRHKALRTLQSVDLCFYLYNILLTPSYMLTLYHINVTI